MNNRIVTQPQTKDKTELYHGGKVVAVVRRAELYKSMVGSKHFLRRPPAIAFDVAQLDEAESAGAKTLRIVDRETGKVFCTTMERVRRDGFPLSRGYGRQWALELIFWSIDGERPAADVQAARTNAAVKALQPSLFGGVA